MMSDGNEPVWRTGVVQPQILSREAQRLAALHCLELLDTPPCETFDGITRIVAQSLDVPIALVSLVDGKRQWFKSRVGIEASQTSRDASFCAHAVLERQILSVPDATRDSRFAGNPLVTEEPCIRAYLGVPLYSREGHALGTLCAIDTRPRVFDERQCRTLETLAKVVQDLIQARELARASHRLLESAATQEQLFRDTFEHAAAGIAHTGLASRCLRVNQRALDMLGYTEDELLGKSFVDITHPDDVAPNVALFRQLVAGTINGYRLEKRFLCKDQSFLWTHISVALKRSASGEPSYIITVIEEIAARKAMEAELTQARDTLRGEVARQTQLLQQNNAELRSQVSKALESERAVREVEHRLRSIADNVPANIGYWNRELRCEFANQPYRQPFGLGARAIIGMSMRDLLGDALFESIEPHALLALGGQAQRFERVFTQADGTQALMEVRYLPDSHDSVNVRGFFVLATDVTEARDRQLALEAANNQLKKDAVTDFLTGVSNRRVFSERSEEAAKRFQQAGEVYGLILMDLDNFKHINDTHGHAVGDDVLRIVGRLLKRQLRSHRDVAVRLGGEEFAVLCFGELDEEVLRLIAEGLRLQLAQECIKTPGGELRFTASYGLAVSNACDADWTAIYSRADLALYEAKAAGKDRVKFATASVPGATGRFRRLRLIPR